MLESAARTLLDFGRSRLHAQLGVTTVLHTWTRDLRFHPHAHCIVTAGGLDDEGHSDPGAQPLPLPGQGDVQGLPRQTPRRPRAALCSDRLSTSPVPARIWPTQQSLRGVAQGPAVSQGVGGLRQASLRRTSSTSSNTSVAIPTGSASRISDCSASTDTRSASVPSMVGTATVEAVEFVRRFPAARPPAGFVKNPTLRAGRCGKRTTKLEIARRCLLDVDEHTPPQSPPSGPVPWRDLFFALTGIDLLNLPHLWQPSDRAASPASTRSPSPPGQIMIVAICLPRSPSGITLAGAEVHTGRFNGTDSRPATCRCPSSIARAFTAYGATRHGDPPSGTRSATRDLNPPIALEPAAQFNLRLLERSQSGERHGWTAPESRAILRSSKPY